MNAALPTPFVPQLRDVFLMPGELHCATVPSLITTVLGSCIAVCLWDRVRRMGGMNHYVLPSSRTDPDSTRYGDVAIDRLIDGMLELGSRPKDLVAKIFGGAAVLAIGASTDSAVGARNQQLALERLGRYRIPVLVCRTGGERGKLIKFDTESGQVAIRPIAAMAESDTHRPTSGSRR